MYVCIDIHIYKYIYTSMYMYILFYLYRFVFRLCFVCPMFLTYDVFCDCVAVLYLCEICVTEYYPACSIRTQHNV